ncbi:MULTISPECIES: MFS transporter [unclassified Streptomyces]|uniref:MFS transporter n=1 Tax=unclassified Streptomyces TaxID=2593676 RepID=UPI0033F7B655
MTEAEPAADTARPSLLRHRDFMLLWGGQTVSEVGSMITPFVLPFLAITALDASNFEVGLLTALGTLAFLLVALPAGVIVDRVARHRLMMWCDLVRAAVVATVPVAWYLDTLTLTHLCVVALVTGSLTVFFDVAYQSYVPALVTKEQLIDANGKLGTTSSAAATLGPTVAGVLVAAIGGARALVADALSFLVSAVSLFLIRTPEPKPARPDGPRTTFREQMSEGLGFVVRHPVLRRIVACTATVNLFSHMASAMEIPFLVRELGLSSSQAGLLLALGPVGGVLGGLLAGRLARRVGSARIIWLAPLACGVPSYLVPLAYNGWRVVFFGIGWFAFTFGAIVYNTAQVTYRQQLCPPELLGRMNAAVRWIVWGTIPLGALVGGALATWIGLRPTLWVGVVGASLGGLWVLFSPLRRLRDVPPDHTAAAVS